MLEQGGRRISKKRFNVNHYGEGIVMKLALGSKIKQLRLQKGITQDTLAKALNVSYQTVSKWENETSMPDIQLLPELAVYFGCSIDELFDLSEQAQFDRIENLMQMQQNLSPEEFQQEQAFLKAKLNQADRKSDALRLLSSLFNHEADTLRNLAEFYAKEALELEPERKENHSNLQRAQEGTVPDWDLGNHSQRIAYYQQFVQKNPTYLGGYLWLLDELIADNRLEEAAKVCDALEQMDDSCRTAFYRGKIAWKSGDHQKAEAIWLRMLENHGNDWLTFASMADAMASVCRYEEAIGYYKKAQQLQPSPKYADAQTAVTHIYEIQGKFEEAINTLNEQLELLKREWNLTEGCEVERIHREIHRLRQRALNQIVG